MDELLSTLYVNPASVTVRITEASSRRFGDYDITPAVPVYDHRQGDFLGCCSMDFERLLELFGEQALVEVDQSGHAERQVASAWLVGDQASPLPLP